MWALKNKRKFGRVGRLHRSWKPAGCKRLRGFESLSFRTNYKCRERCWFESNIRNILIYRWLAQLVRAQHWYCWGHWFNSNITYSKKPSTFYVMFWTWSVRQGTVKESHRSITVWYKEITLGVLVKSQSHIKFYLGGVLEMVFYIMVYSFTS